MSELVDVAHAVAAAARHNGRTVAAAESITAGTIATALAAAPEASEWFRGSVVAYQTLMKRDVLGVTADDVITAECAMQMAQGVARRTGADVVVSVTGVGGPDSEDGHAPGTVLICTSSDSGVRVHDYRFDAPPEEVVKLAALHALRHLLVATREPAWNTP